MESLSSDKKRRTVEMLRQIESAISDLELWNREIHTPDDYYVSPYGMRNLAASCMLIEAIGESFKQIDKITDGRLLVMRNDIPWKEVIGMRNHIAHGYFDIDGEVVFTTIKYELQKLSNAVTYFLNILE